MTKITDMPLDTIVEILSYLKLDEVCRLAPLHSRLNKASKYCTSWEINLSDLRGRKKLVSCLEDKIDFLKGEGLKLKQLRLVFPYQPWVRREIDRVMEFAFTDSLEILELTCYGKTPFLADNLQLSLPNVLGLRNIKVPLSLEFDSNLRDFNFDIGIHGYPDGLVFDFRKSDFMELFGYGGGPDGLWPNVYWPRLGGRLKSLAIFNAKIQDFEIGLVVELCKELKILSIEECEYLTNPMIKSGSLSKLIVFRCSSIEHLTIVAPLMDAFLFGDTFIKGSPTIEAFDGSFTDSRLTVIIINQISDFVLGNIKAMLLNSTVKFSSITAVGSNEQARHPDVDVEGQFPFLNDVYETELLSLNDVQGVCGRLLRGMLYVCKPRTVEFEINLKQDFPTSIIDQLNTLKRNKIIDFSVLEVNSDMLITNSIMRVKIRILEMGKIPQQ